MKLNFEFTPKIDKEFLLSKFSEETYMEHYLGVKVSKKLIKNPLRNDHNPTASFYRNKSGELIFNDFGSNFHGNFITVVMTKYNCNYYQACEQIAKDFNLVITDTPNRKTVFIESSKTQFKDSGPSKIQIQEQRFTENELKWWGQFGITAKILRKFNVYSCKSIFLNNNLLAQSSDRCPIYGYYFGEKDKRELWRIYFPMRKSYRFLSNTDCKKIQGFKQLPKEGKLLVITKSMKDVMCLYSLGITAIAPNSEKLFVSEDVLSNLKNRFKYIVVLYDNDIPGLEGMRTIKKQHPELIYTWLPRKYAKDISDFHKKYGKEKTLTILKMFVKWLGNRQKN